MFELQSGGFSTPSGWSAVSDRQESCCTFWCQYHGVSRIVERFVAAIERLASEVYGLTCAGPRLMDRVQRGFLMSKQEDSAAHSSPTVLDSVCSRKVAVALGASSCALEREQHRTVLSETDSSGLRLRRCCVGMPWEHTALAGLLHVCSLALVAFACAFAEAATGIECDTSIAAQLSQL